MKMKFKRVHQLGYVVEDMEKAMDEYGKIYGIKAWYRAVNNPVGQLYYKGQPFTDPGYDVVLGYCGKTEIELITTGGAENIYTAFIRAHGYGLHHFCFFVRDIRPYVAEYEKRGWVVTQNGVINGKSTKSHFAYLTRPDDETGTVVEFGDTHWGFLRMTRSKLNMALGVLTGNAIRIR